MKIKERKKIVTSLSAVGGVEVYLSLMIRARRALEEEAGAVMKKSLPTPRDATFPGIAFSNAALARHPEQ